MSELTKLMERCRQLQIKHDRRIPVQLELTEEPMSPYPYNENLDDSLEPIDWEVIAPQCDDTYAILELLRDTLLEDVKELSFSNPKDREAIRLLLDNLDTISRVEGMVRELIDPTFLGDNPQGPIGAIA